MYPYPDAINPYVHAQGFDKLCEHSLNRRGVGAFAFIAVTQSERARRRQERAVAKAWSVYKGDLYRINMVRDRVSEVGLVILTNGGIFKDFVLCCKKIRRSGKTKDELFEDFVKGGFPIDPQKFWDPAEMYRPPAYLLNR